MDSSEEKDKTSADPFAGDIFADAKTQNQPPETANTETVVEPLLWNRNLKKAALSKTDWNNLHRNLPLNFIEELPGTLIASLAELIDSADKTIGELLFINEREINRSEEVPPINPDSWWITTAIENSSAEIYLEIGNVFAGWLVDAILNENVSEKTAIRQLTPSEAAILEFAALQLTHDANQILQSPIFKFRALKNQIPNQLEKTFETKTPSLLIADWQIVYGKQSSLVKIYVVPEALEALQPAENSLLNPPSHRANWSRYQTRAENLRLRISFGQAELSLAELAALENGDIVLLEKLPFFLQNGHLKGHAEIYVGDEENTRITGNLISSGFGQPENIAQTAARNDNKTLVRQLSANSRLHLSITEITETERPRLFEKSMAEENENQAETGETELAEPAEKGLSLENIGVTLRVELEARRLSLEEAANLRVNQVIDLGAAPTDSVNLLINDKIVGRGEIVEVENRLGVRILKLLN